MNWQDNDLLLEHYDRIKRYIAYRAGSDQAEDLTQQVFLKANQAIDSFQNKSSLYTWLYSIATNTIINEAKRSYRTKELLAARETNCSRFLTTDFTKEVDFKIDLGTSLNKLDRLDQEILTLRYVADYSFRDIAKLLKMNESSLKNRMYRCLGKMRNDLESWHVTAPFNPKQYILMVNMLETGHSGPEFQKVTEDFMAILRKNFRRITTALNYIPETKITYEIYPDQETMLGEDYTPAHTIIGGFGKLNHVMIVSPLNPGPKYNYHNIIQRSLALYTKALTKQMNPSLPTFLLHGIGEYVGQEWSREQVKRRITSICRHREVLSIQRLRDTGSEAFLRIGGREFVYTFIDFIVTNYNWEALHRLIRDPASIELILQSSEDQVETEWKRFVLEQYIDHGSSDLRPSSKEITRLKIVVPDSNSRSTNYRMFKFIEYAKAFERTNPGVRVIVDAVPLKYYYGKQLPIRLREAAEVDLLFGPYISGISKQGIFADLFPRFQGDGARLNDLHKPLIDMVTVDGNLSAIPMSPDPLAVFYNKEWFANAGLPDPAGDWTWEQFFTVSVKLKEANTLESKESYGSVVPLIVDFIESLAQSGGGSLLSPDNRQLTGYSNSPIVADVFNMFLNRKNNPDFVKIVYDGTTSIVSEIYSGNAGMGVGRLRNYPVFTRDLKLNGKIGVAPLPRLMKGVRANVVLVEALSIVAASNQQQLAWKFIKDIVLNPESEFHIGWSKREMLGSRSTIRKLGQDNDPGWKVGIEELEHAVMPIAYRNPRIKGSSLASYIQGSTSTLAEIQSLLSQAASKTDKLLLAEE